MQSVDDKTVQEVKDALVQNKNMVILDVRTPVEYQAGHIDGSINMPLGEEPINQTLDYTNQIVVVHCKSGMRSSRWLAMNPDRIKALAIWHMFEGMDGWLAQ